MDFDDSRGRINAVRLLDRLERTSASLKPPTAGPDVAGGDDEKDSSAKYWELKGLETTIKHARTVLDTLPPSPQGAGVPQLTPAKISEMKARLSAVEERVKAAVRACPSPYPTGPACPASVQWAGSFTFRKPSPPPLPQISIQPDAPPLDKPGASPCEAAELRLPPAAEVAAAADFAPAGRAGPEPVPFASPRDELLTGARPTPASSRSKDTGGQTSSVESILQHHRSTQDSLTDELSQLASQLRRNAVHFSSVLGSDRALVENASVKLETNLTSMQKEGGRLGKYAETARGTTWWTIIAVFVVAVAWTIMFILIRLT